MSTLPSTTPFQGDLSVFGLLDIIQLIHTAQKTGQLRVLGADHSDAGEMVFNDGRLVDARCMGHYDEEAVRDLLRMHEGSFQFYPRFEPFAVRIDLSTPTLLMRCLKQIDEEKASGPDREAWVAGRSA